LRSERGSTILEYLIILGAAAMIYFGGPLLLHGVQDWLALVNAERVAMHQVVVNGFYSPCAQQRLDEALEAANIPPALVAAQGTATQQQYGQPVKLALQYTYSPASWIHIPLSAISRTISQYLPGQAAGGGCPPAGNEEVATGVGIPATITIYADHNPANVSQLVTFCGEVVDQYGNPVGTNVFVSGGGQSARVYAQGGHYSAVFSFASAGSVTVGATAGSASVGIQEVIVTSAPVITGVTIKYNPGLYGGDTSFVVNGDGFGTLPGDWVVGSSAPITKAITVTNCRSQTVQDTPWLLIADPSPGHGASGPWVSGLYNPNLPAQGPCIGLWIQSWTPTQVIVTQLGNDMAFGWYALSPGDTVNITIWNPQSGQSAFWMGVVP